MDVAALACKVESDHRPKEVSLTLRPCGYSHNQMVVKALDTTGVVVPPMEIGLCLRPINFTSRRMKTEDLAMFLEYWRIMGIHHIHLYYSNLPVKFKKLLQVYQKEALTFVTSSNWTYIHQMAEEVVSSEAAVNHCVMKNMMSYRYIIVTSLPYIPIFGDNKKFHNMKQVVRDPSFKSEIETKSGFRITKLDDTPYETLIMRPRDVLATSAKHFIPLSAEPSFSILSPFNVVMQNMTHLWQQDVIPGLNKEQVTHLKETVKKAADKRIKRAMI